MVLCYFHPLWFHLTPCARWDRFPCRAAMVACGCRIDSPAALAFTVLCALAPMPHYLFLLWWTWIACHAVNVLIAPPTTTNAPTSRVTAPVVISSPFSPFFFYCCITTAWFCQYLPAVLIPAFERSSTPGTGWTSHLYRTYLALWFLALYAGALFLLRTRFPPLALTRNLACQDLLEDSYGWFLPRVSMLPVLEE